MMEVKVLKERKGKPTVIEYSGIRFVAQPEHLAKARGVKRNVKTEGISR